MPDIPDEAVQRATEDLTAWMLKMDWMTGLSAEQVRIVCRDAATRVLEAAAPVLARAQVEAVRRLPHWSGIAKGERDAEGE